MNLFCHLTLSICLMSCAEAFHMHFMYGLLYFDSILYRTENLVNRGKRTLCFHTSPYFSVPF